MFAFVFFVVLMLLPSAGISLRRFSTPSLFIIFYIVFDYIGILPLYLEWDAYAIYLGVVNKEIVFRMFMYSSVALITIILGFIYARYVLGLNSKVISRRVMMKANISQLTLNVCLLLLCVLVLLAYLRQLDSIAIVKALEGDYAAAQESRSNMGNAFVGKYWRYQIFMRYLLDYCVIFFFADYLVKRSRILGLMFGVSLIVAGFSATIAIEKGPFVKLLIMLYLVYIIYKGGNYWQSAARYFLVISICSISLFYIYFTNTVGIMSVLVEILSRVFIRQITPAYFYLDLFPQHIDYLMGASFPNPGGLLPFENYPLTMKISQHIYPENILTGVVGTAPTVFWGEMYANFGPAAIIILSFLVGIGLFAISQIVLKLPLSPPVIAAVVTLAMHYSDLTGTSLSNYFFDTTLLAIAIVTLISVILNRKNPKNYGSFVKKLNCD